MATTDTDSEDIYKMREEIHSPFRSSLFRSSPFRSPPSSPVLCRRIYNQRPKCTQKADVTIYPPVDQRNIKKKHEDQDQSAIENCTICLERLTRHKCFVLPRCGHMVHIHCLNRWEMEKPSCPVCRVVISSTDGGLDIPSDIERWVMYGAPKRLRMIRGQRATKGNW